MAVLIERRVRTHACLSGWSCLSRGERSVTSTGDEAGQSHCHFRLFNVSVLFVHSPFDYSMPVSFHEVSPRRMQRIMPHGSVVQLPELQGFARWLYAGESGTVANRSMPVKTIRESGTDANIPHPLLSKVALSRCSPSSVVQGGIIQMKVRARKQRVAQQYATVLFKMALTS